MEEPALGTLHRGLADGGAVRFLSVEALALAAHIRRIHELGDDEGRLAAEGAVAALFLSAWIKGAERLTLQIQSERPRFSFIADVTAEGGVRARMSPHRIGVHPFPAGVDGAMLAIKSDADRELYRGVTLLEDQRIADALSGHLRDSAQVDAVLRIDPVRASGVLIERLPAHPVHPSIDADTFAERYGGGPPLDGAVEVLERRTVHWHCSCGQGRIEQVLSLLSAEVLQEMLDDDGGAEVICHFCNIAYDVSAARLEALIRPTSRSP